MGHEDYRFSQALLQGQEFTLQFGASDGIERAEWFVHEEKLQDRRPARGLRRLSAAGRRIVHADSGCELSFKADEFQ